MATVEGSGSGGAPAGALDRLQRVLGALKSIAEAGHAAGPGQLVPTLLRIASEATTSSHAALFWLDEDGQDLVVTDAVGPSRVTAGAYARIPLQGTHAGATMRSLDAMALTVDQVPLVLQQPMREAGLVFGALLPLQIQGKAEGVLSLWRSTRGYDADELVAAQSLADPIALQIGRARLDADVQRRARDLQLINELGAVIAEQLDLGTVLSLGINQLTRIAEAPHAFVMMKVGEVLRTMATNVEGGDNVVVTKDETSVLRVAERERRPIVVDDTEHDDRASPVRIRRFGETALLAVPLLTRGEVIGVVLLAHTEISRRFSQRQVDLVVALTNQIATAIANARLLEETKRSYAELRRTQQHLVERERLAALGELAAVVAHEIRNPLAVIFNSMASLRRPSPDQENQGLLLGIVAEEASRINRIISDLLEFARPGEARLAMHDLEVVVSGAVEAARSAVGRPAPAIEVEVRTTLGPVPADAQLVRQALINLLVNAIHADPDGPLTLRISEELRGGQPFARIDVEDHGPGIPSAIQLRVFQPFFTTKAQGTGLGLAIVKRIAEVHHGDVSVRSDPDATVFTLLLPTRLEEPPVLLSS